MDCVYSDTKQFHVSENIQKIVLWMFSDTWNCFVSKYTQSMCPDVCIHYCITEIVTYPHFTEILTTVISGNVLPVK